MAGLGLAAGYGAGAAGATLGDILKQKFLEQMQRQQLAEQARQADMRQQTALQGLNMQQQNLDENRALRMQSLKSLDEDRAARAADRAEGRQIQEDNTFKAGIALRRPGSYVSPVEQVKFLKTDQTGMTQAAGADPHSNDPHFHFTGTALQEDADARAKALADKTTSDREFTHDENEANRKNALRVAGMRGATQAGTGLTEAAIDQAARSYLSSGAMPALGMGAAGTRIAIMNRAGEIDPQRSVSLAKADYGADAGSLKSLQQTADSLTAFHHAARANLSQFESTLAKLPDSGRPFLNTPIRAWAQHGAGSTEVAAAEAARLTALREIARVTNNPRLTGQLSDAARKEVENLIPENATVAQIRRVMTVLERDMSNVENETNAQLGVIRGRMQGNTPGGAPAPTTPAPAGKPDAAALIKKYGGG